MGTPTYINPTGAARGAGQLPVPNIPGIGVVDLPSGSKRGLMVYMHGLADSYLPPTLSMVDVTGILPGLSKTLHDDLIAEGWGVLQIPYPEDSYGPDVPAAGLYQDVVNDPGHGSRYVNTFGLTWGLVAAYRDRNFPGWPIVPVGGSHGGYSALRVVSQAPSTCLAAIAHVPATVWRNVDPIFLAASAPLNSIDTSGMDLTAGCLVGTTQPIYVGYHTDDSAVGYSGNSAIQAGSIGVNVSSVSTLNIASSSGYLTAVLVTVPTSNGFATFSFAGTGAGTLTGCTLVSGSGTIVAGNAVQSLTTSIIAAAGSNVTVPTPGTGGHCMNTTDVSNIMSFVVGLRGIAPAVF